MGTDEAEESPPRHTRERGEQGDSARRKKQLTQIKEWKELHEDWEGEADLWAGAGVDDADAVLTEEPRQNSSKGERPVENVPGRKRGLPHGRSEPRPWQVEIRITDEVLTTSAEAALENEQIDNAMTAVAALGIVQNLKKEDCRRGARRWIKVRTNGPGASRAP